MKFKVTPFIIVSLIMLVLTFYFGYKPPKGYGALIFLVTGFLFLMALVLDLIFRSTVKKRKTIWIVETIILLIGCAFLYLDL